jgi:sigma-B regulation protein RsbU (phosphoserine phosphatase)
MKFLSFRGKIFLLLTVILLLVAASIVTMSRRDMLVAVSDAERHAVENVMHLAARDIGAVWDTLFTSKVRNVREKRDDLTAINESAVSVLQAFVDLARNEGKEPRAAQQMANAWLRGSPMFRERQMFAYDENSRIRISSSPELEGADISTLIDIKGQPLAASLREETRRFRKGFAVYRQSPGSGQGGQTQFASFFYFKPWDWVVVVAEDGQDVLDDVTFQRATMETQLNESLGRITLSSSGFLVLRDDGGRFVVPPKQAHPGLLDEAFFARVEAERSEDLRTFRMTPENETWHVSHQYFRPLGWTLLAIVPERDFVAPAEQLIGRQLIAFAVVLFAVWLFAALVAGHIVTPLSVLTRFVHRLPDEDLTAAAEIPPAIARLSAGQKDEIGQLAGAFLAMSGKLRDNVAQLVRETAERGRFENELKIASDIQLGLLPQPLPEEARAAVDLASFMLPAREVGGDLYDYFLLPDARSLCLVIGDVSGKGVPAALFMAITRTLVRLAAESETDPARIVARVNNRLAENNPNLMFVTLLVGVLSLADGELRWCNAGHPPPLIRLPDGSVDVLEGRSGPACGVRGEWAYRAFSRRLQAGETLLGYTDGVSEAVDAGDGQYGEGRLKAVFAEAPPEGARALVDRVVSDVRAFAAGVEQFDDITLMAIRRS